MKRRKSGPPSPLHSISSEAKQKENKEKKRTWIQDVNVHRQVDGVVLALGRREGVHDGLDHARGANVVDVVGADAHPVLRGVVFVVPPGVAAQARAQARVQRGRRAGVGEQAFLAREPEHGPMVEAGLLRRPRAGVLVRVPRIEVRCAR